MTTVNEVTQRIAMSGIGLGLMTEVAHKLASGDEDAQTYVAKLGGAALAHQSEVDLMVATDAVALAATIVRRDSGEEAFASFLNLMAGMIAMEADTHTCDEPL